MNYYVIDTLYNYIYLFKEILIFIMKKYVVETFYTCTFKTVHKLNNLDDNELSKIDQRNDGEVEVIDVKLNNRKTKKLVDKKEEELNKNQIESIPATIPLKNERSKY